MLKFDFLWIFYEFLIILIEFHRCKKIEALKFNLDELAYLLGIGIKTKEVEIIVTGLEDIWVE